MRSKAEGAIEFSPITKVKFHFLGSLNMKGGGKIIGCASDEENAWAY
jgi:hypothetical protein